MRVQRWGKRVVLLAAVGLLGAEASPAWAAVGYAGHHCNPSCAVFQSPFFGYYRTCWRPWPGGQPPCPICPKPVTLEPATAVPPSGEPVAPSETAAKPAEALPAPAPVESVPAPAPTEPAAPKPTPPRK